VQPMTDTGGFVTPQGQAAYRREKELAQKFTEDVLWVLRTQEDTTPRMLHPYLSMVPGYSESIVREAMWILLDRGEIELKPDMGLTLAKPAPSTAEERTDG